MQKITPFLWFDGQAEEAARFYTSIFKNSHIGDSSDYDEKTAEQTGQQPGSPMTVEFTLDGQKFVGLNGGPMFKFTEAVSFAISCEDQAEVDYYWERLTADGGEESMCGWLKDKFGLSWQVVPKRLLELLRDGEKAPKIMGAVMQMKKLDIATIEAAAEA